MGEGLLQVRLFNTNGSWGTACEYTSWWNEPAAGVACWQLGWQREGAQRVAGSRFADASGLPITFAHVYCSGGEHSLDECSFDLNSPYNPACEHSGDMGLRCQGEPAAAARAGRALCWQPAVHACARLSTRCPALLCRPQAQPMTEWRHVPLRGALERERVTVYDSL